MSIHPKKGGLIDMDRTMVLSTDERSGRVDKARNVGLVESAERPEPPGLQILKLLGEGGTSRVYLALDESTGEEVALKIMNIDLQDSTGLRRFIQEFTIFAAEKHPNITRLIERSFTSNFAYITMEYFSGGDLSDRIAGGCSPKEAVLIVKSIAAGLGVAHERGIIHRDIKPSNIMFRADGSLAITDFGIARLDRDSEAAWAARTITMIGQTIGTPYYMSPEQISDETDVDHRTDLYSLGVLFFECLTGEKPFRSGSLPDLLEAHLKNVPPELPGELARYQTMVSRLMAKNPEDRFQSAAEVITELGGHIG